MGAARTLVLPKTRDVPRGGMDRYSERADRRLDRPRSANESKVERPLSNNHDADPKGLDKRHEPTEGKIYQEEQTTARRSPPMAARFLAVRD